MDDWLRTELFAFGRTMSTGGCARVVVCVSACDSTGADQIQCQVILYPAGYWYSTEHWVARGLACHREGLAEDITDDPIDAAWWQKAPGPGKMDYLLPPPGRQGANHYRCYQGTLFWYRTRLKQALVIVSLHIQACSKLALAHGIAMLWAHLESCQALILQLDPDPYKTLTIPGVQIYHTCRWPHLARPVEERNLSSISTRGVQGQRLPKEQQPQPWYDAGHTRFIYHRDLSP